MIQAMAPEDGCDLADRNRFATFRSSLNSWTIPRPIAVQTTDTQIPVIMRSITAHPENYSVSWMEENYEVNQISNAPT
jgi:hypothetical protein